MTTDAKYTMQIAYLVSKYPAVSHTFVEREIRELENLDFTIERFSVRRAGKNETLGEKAKSEADRTKVLLSFSPVSMAAAFVWLLATRPRRALTTVIDAVSEPVGIKQKLKWLAYYAEATRMAWQVTRSRAAHIHCHFGNSGSNVAWLAARLCGLPYSITFHGIDLDEPEMFRHRDKIRDAAFAVCISDTGKRQLLRSTSPRDEFKVHVVRCGYPLPREEDIPPYPHANRILCIARIAPEKGHEILLDALALLRQRGLDFHCTLIGDGPLAGHIRDRIVALDLQDHVTMTGALPPSDVYDHVGQADILVLASYGEGIPVALMEALAQRRPVVATAVGGIPELVRDGMEGRLVAPGDAAALADAVAALLDDPETAARMGDCGRAAVSSRHDPKLSARRMRDLFVPSISGA